VHLLVYAWILTISAGTRIPQNSWISKLKFHRFKFVINRGLLCRSNQEYARRHSLSWRHTSPSAFQKIPHIVCNLKVHYRVHNSQPASMQSTPFNYIYLRSVLILPSRLYLGLPSGLFPLRFPHQNPVGTSHIPRACHIPRPSQPSWADHRLSIWLRSLWRGSSSTVFPSPCCLTPLGPNIRFQSRKKEIPLPRNCFQSWLHHQSLPWFCDANLRSHYKHTGVQKYTLLNHRE